MGHVRACWSRPTNAGTQHNLPWRSHQAAGADALQLRLEVRHVRSAVGQELLRRSGGRLGPSSAARIFVKRLRRRGCGSQRARGRIHGKPFVHAMAGRARPPGRSPASPHACSRSPPPAEGPGPWPTSRDPSAPACPPLSGGRTPSPTTGWGPASPASPANRSSREVLRSRRLPRDSGGGAEASKRLLCKCVRSVREPPVQRPSAGWIADAMMHHIGDVRARCRGLFEKQSLCRQPAPEFKLLAYPGTADTCGLIAALPTCSSLLHIACRLSFAGHIKP